MLDGIHILNKISITEIPNWCYITSIAVMVVIFLAILLYGIICEHELIGGLFLGLVGGLFIGLLTLVVLDFFVQDIPTGEYKYQVTIDQSVSFIEFNEKYYVIKQDGEIYTIGKR